MAAVVGLACAVTRREGCRGLRRPKTRRSGLHRHGRPAGTADRGECRAHAELRGPAAARHARGP